MTSRIFYFTCNWAVKHSLLLFYTTITTDKWPHRSIYFMHIIAFAFGSTCILLTIFQCTPISKMWNGPVDPTVSGHCINMDSFDYFNSSFMLATDIVLYAMPLVFTRHLTISRTQRIAINLLFALGGLVLAASGTRVYFVHAQATSPDFTCSFATTMLCAVIENHLAIIVACAPSIKAILLHTFSSLTVKFENFVNKPSPTASVFMSSDISTTVADMEIGSKEEVTWDARSVSPHTVTKSNKCREGRQWWKALSTWEINKELEKRSNLYSSL
jgi:hypothetical protein